MDHFDYLMLDYIGTILCFLVLVVVALVSCRFHSLNTSKGGWMDVWMVAVYCVVQYAQLEGTAPYGCLLLPPVEGWWPLATWIAVKKKNGSPLLPPPPYSLHRVKKNKNKKKPFFYMGPPLYPPPAAAPPNPLHRVFFYPHFL